MPTRPDYQSIGRYLRSNETLESLSLRSRNHEELLISVRSRLPDPIGDHCLAAVLSEGVLTLYVDSPAWATHARFLKEPLQRDLHPLGISFAQLKIKVFRPFYRSTRHHRPSLVLSPENASLLKLGASGVSDPQLAEALLRLAERAGGKKGFC